MRIFCEFWRCFSAPGAVWRKRVVSYFRAHHALCPRPGQQIGARIIDLSPKLAACRALAGRPEAFQLAYSKTTLRNAQSGLWPRADAPGCSPAPARGGLARGGNVHPDPDLGRQVRRRRLRRGRRGGATSVHDRKAVQSRASNQPLGPVKTRACRCKRSPAVVAPRAVAYDYAVGERGAPADGYKRLAAPPTGDEKGGDAHEEIAAQHGGRGPRPWPFSRVAWHRLERRRTIKLRSM